MRKAAYCETGSSYAKEGKFSDLSDPEVHSSLTRKR